MNFNVFLVEDDEVDVINVKRAFEVLQLTNPLYVARNGLEALEMLNNKAIPSPVLTLLDINMPRMGGLEFLKLVRDNRDWHSLPTVILTTSDYDKDISEAYNLNAAGYIVKPFTFEGMRDVISRIHMYWSINELP